MRSRSSSSCRAGAIVIAAFGAFALLWRRKPCSTSRAEIWYKYASSLSKFVRHSSLDNPGNDSRTGVTPCLAVRAADPPQAIGAAVNPASARYGLVQPATDHSVIYSRISEHIPGAGQLPLAEFERKARALLQDLRQADATRDLASGTHVPFMLPQGRVTDLGQTLEDVYLPALGRSWKARYPKYEFKNELKGGLAGKLTAAAGSRYEQLLQAMADGPVVGIYFPLSLAGYSVDAALRQMSDLPAGAVLSGPLDMTAALTGCPELIMKEDGYPPQTEDRSP